MQRNEKKDVWRLKNPLRFFASSRLCVKKIARRRSRMDSEECFDCFCHNVKSDPFSSNNNKKNGSGTGGYLERLAVGF